MNLETKYISVFIDTDLSVYDMLDEYSNEITIIHGFFLNYRYQKRYLYLNMR